MAMARDTEVDHRSYLLTLDLSHMVKSYEQAGLKTNPVLMAELTQRLIRRIRGIFPDLEVTVLELAKVKEGVHQLLEKSLHLHPEAIVITTNRFLCPKPNCDAEDTACCLEINRIVDESGGSIGLGPRPWHNSPDLQVRRIAELYGQRPIIILEDGSWSGKTVAQLVIDCQQANLDVAEVICGIMFDQGYSQIRKSGFHRDISFVSLQEDCLDWMPDHDFYPFVPACGRVVGHREDGKGFIPTQVNGFSLAYPYILPYGKPQEWANIPEAHAVPFSRECLADTITLFEDMEAINGQPLSAGTITKLYPRTSFPHRQGKSHRLSDPARRIVDILHEDYHDVKEVAPK